MAGHRQQAVKDATPALPLARGPPVVTLAAGSRTAGIETAHTPATLLPEHSDMLAYRLHTGNTAACYLLRGRTFTQDAFPVMPTALVIYAFSS